MSARVSFTDLLRKGAEKDQKKIDEKPKLPLVDSNNIPTPLTALTLPTPPTERTPPTTATKLIQATPPTSDVNLPVSPERDFAKVANSIVREAVAQGLFIGKSKQIYDFLYLQTRGSIQPARNVRITKSNLMRGSDVGSERTLLKNLSHLKAVGLIKIREFDGQHGGNEYEVFLPEESQATPPTVGTARQPHYALQKVGTLPSVESGVGGVGQTPVNKDTYSDAKTSFKDYNTNDDEEVFASFIEKFQTATKEITGKKLSKRDSENLGNIADLLILELKIAARRTDTISSVPAFLTEVLRRKLRNTSTNAKISKVRADTVGKPESNSYEIKLLDGKGRAEALGHLREFADEDFLPDFKKWYLDEDWEWLMTNLKN